MGILVGVKAMTARSVLIASASALTLIGAAQASELQPIHGRSIALGGLSGTAYYTVERDGYRVVATLSPGEAGTPVRLEAILVSGQSVVLSTPREVGMAARAVEISRRGDKVLVRDAPVTN
jgi:hypothetical protein